MDINLEIAQATVIGGVIEKPEQAGLVFSTVRIEDFDQQYRLMAEAIHGLRLARAPITVLSVVDEMTKRGTLGKAGGQAEVHRVAQFGFGSVDYSVEIVARFARLRTLAAATTLTGARTQDPDADPAALARYVIDAAQAVIDGIEADGDVTTPTIGEFLLGEDDPFDWVIPGVLERGDRLMLTGSEGLGKSVLFRQLAVSAAAGVHPFTHRPITPQRVLYVDCENGVSPLRRAMRGLVQQGRAHGTDPSQMLYLEARPEGLDLTRQEDETWLVRRVAALQPSMLLIGPLYRLHAKNPNDEEPARKVAAVLDRCRAAANCALVVEAHAGHGFSADGKRPVRPTGSSLWLRWPEFGYGLRAGDDYDPTRRVVDFVPWRGDRSERDWPTQLVSGGTWPWERQQDTTTSPITSYYERD